MNFTFVKLQLLCIPHAYFPKELTIRCDLSCTIRNAQRDTSLLKTKFFIVLRQETPKQYVKICYIIFTSALFREID